MGYEDTGGGEGYFQELMSSLFHVAGIDYLDMKR